MSDDVRATLRRLRDEAAVEARALDEDLRRLFEASRSSNLDDEHDPEGSTVAYERAQLTAILDATRQRRADLDEALARLETGTYGRCERCGRPVPAERLAVRPAARTCVSCA